MRHQLQRYEGTPYEVQPEDTVIDLIEEGVDTFAFEVGPHCNGPKCVACGEAKCHHHWPNWWLTEECPGQ